MTFLSYEELQALREYTEANNNHPNQVLTIRRDELVALLDMIAAAERMMQ